MDDIDDSVDIFVSLGSFFGQPREGAGPDLDSLLLELSPQTVAAHLALGLGAAHDAPRPMPRRSKGKRHTAFGAHEHPRGGTHRTWNEHRLPQRTVLLGHFARARAKCARGALAMDAHLRRSSLD